MPSPFPGMDPFLEGPAYFPGFHSRLISQFCDQLLSLLPAPYYADLNERLWVDASDRSIGPDVSLLRDDGPNSGGVVTASSHTARPVVVTVPHDERRQTYVEIFCRRKDEQLVTSIELLSRSNKTPGENGRELYLKKQREVLESQVHLVEIDLLRAGTHTTAVPLARALKKTGPFDYHVCIHHFDNLEDFFLYPVLLPQRLPAIHIPLLPGDGGVTVDLQAVFEKAYASGPYNRRLRYTDPVPPPALSDEQQAWVAGVLRQAGLLPPSA